MTYHHLTHSDRIQIGALLQRNFSVPEIAEEMGRPKCTIYRELHRNSFDGMYFVETAQALATHRKSIASKDRPFDEELWSQIQKGLNHGMSPEQISGRMKIEIANVNVSASSIYRWVYADKDTGGNLWCCLRRSGKTYRRKYASNSTTSNGIKNRVSIEERPKIVESKRRSGDLEADTMIGAKHSGAILTMNDRVTYKVALQKLQNKESDLVREKLIHGVGKFAGPKHTCTVDNGKEFAEHEAFTLATGIQMYFSHPMSPHERGANENINGLIRQYLPKGTDFKTVTDQQLEKIEYSLNSRPRKTLNYLTPLEAETGKALAFYFFSN